MSYTVTDKRKQKAPRPQCRVCGSSIVHSHDYGHPTMECIKEQRAVILALEEALRAAKLDVAVMATQGSLSSQETLAEIDALLHDSTEHEESGDV